MVPDIRKQRAIDHPDEAAAQEKARQKEEAAAERARRKAEREAKKAEKERLQAEKAARRAESESLISEIIQSNQKNTINHDDDK